MFRTSVRMEEVDLNIELAPNRHTTFFFRAQNAGENDEISPHDELVVDRSLTAHSGDLVIAYDTEEFYVMRYPLPSEYKLWGPITYKIQKLKNIKTLQDIRIEKLEAQRDKEQS
ncbi:MAG: hypothetical protein QM632_01220 [Micrococcaceae bacterium]